MCACWREVGWRGDKAKAKNKLPSRFCFYFLLDYIICDNHISDYKTGNSYSVLRCLVYIDAKTYSSPFVKLVFNMAIV